MTSSMTLIGTPLNVLAEHNLLPTSLSHTIKSPKRFAGSEIVAITKKDIAEITLRDLSSLPFTNDNRLKLAGTVVQAFRKASQNRNTSSISYSKRTEIRESHARIT